MKKWILLLPFSLALFSSCDEVGQDHDPSDFDSLDTLKNVSTGTKNIPVKSILTVLDVKKGVSYVAFESEMFFEAPNMTDDGNSIIFNSNGRLHKLKLYTDGLPDEIRTGFATNCNNDHSVSKDGKWIAFSHQDPEKNISKIYTVSSNGGTPKLITQKGPSYLHGWHPNGQKLVYCAERKGEFDIYSIDIDGKNETRLTSSKGLDDGPEYSPDGKYIYYNSERAGLMQIWRMDADGKNQVQVTNDEFNYWFPHISPDGTKMVFLSYDKSVKGHPANKFVEIKMHTFATGETKTIQKLFGGQGTINVNSWSPDSKKIAFVQYELINLEN
jgi:TolB protein